MLGNKRSRFGAFGLNKEEMSYVQKRLEKDDKKTVTVNQLNRIVYVQIIESKKERHLTLEACRKAGSAICAAVNDQKFSDITIVDAEGRPEETLAFAEGIVLNNYQFLKYKKDRKDGHTLKNVFISSKKVSDKEIEQLNISSRATCIARDLINEPVIYLTATQLGEEFKKLGKEAGFKVEVFNKAKIESLKMGGLLSVNYGSPEPPTFTVMEYKPSRAKNRKPFVIVGKGVVYDTGGLSLKPTPGSMDTMKCDMSGAAAAACTMYAIAKAKLPVHVIALTPATDNRPGGNAYTPGDVITMMSGLTVEVLNTDAEGRMILADALHYAKRYSPELCIDLATLTGAAMVAIGKFGMVSMGTAGSRWMDKLKASGNYVFERLAEFPFWEEYDDLIKSNVAEIKNIGGPHGGAITAGKFLARFTDYPWIHLDIAGPAFLTQNDPYKPYGGTGVGVRLLFDFFKRYSGK